jgi:uridine kinase
MASGPPFAVVLPDAELAAVLDTAFPELSREERATLSGFLSRAHAEADLLVAKENATERELLVVVRGQAKLLRGGVEIDVVGPGARLGDLSFVSAMPRPVSVVALSHLELARLPFERFRLLSETHPEVANALFDALVSGLCRRQPRAEPGAGPIVRDRTLPRRSEVSVRIHGVARTVPMGTSARQLLPERIQGHLVVAALIDKRAVSLRTPITSECEVSALTTAHWEGQRIHRHSVALAAIEAARRVDPRCHLEMGPSIGFAQRMVAKGVPAGDLPAFAATLERALGALVAERAVLREEWWTVEEAREYFEKESPAVVGLLQTWRDPAVPLASYGKVYVLQMDPLLPDTGMLEGFQVLSGDDVLLLSYGSEAAARPLPSSMFRIPPVLAPTIGGPASTPQRGPAPGTPIAEESEAAYLARHARRVSAQAATLILGHDRWLGTLGVGSVGEFNRACIGGEVSELIRVSEGFQEKRIGIIADEIRQRFEGARIVCIAGPSSSGKTTFIRRLEVQLRVNGIRPLGLSLDDYYVDRALTPRDMTGGYDYEAFEALRVDLLGDHLRSLLSGETVKTARFDFASGKSDPHGGPEMHLGSDEILLVEGIHGLNPQLVSSLPSDRVFRIFCCPLAQLPFDALTRVHASDVRLIRRIVRDRHTRGTNAAENILRWESVRAGERRHIFPFQHHADAVFDSSLIYELSVLRVYAERYLLEVPGAHPAYMTASRLIRLLDRFVAIYPDHVPPTSILREFIGGSGFEY